MQLQRVEKTIKFPAFPRDELMDDRLRLLKDRVINAIKQDLCGVDCGLAHANVPFEPCTPCCEVFLVLILLS